MMVFKEVSNLLVLSLHYRYFVLVLQLRRARLEARMQTIISVAHDVNLMFQLFGLDGMIEVGVEPNRLSSSSSSLFLLDLLDLLELTLTLK